MWSLFQEYISTRPIRFFDSFPSTVKSLNPLKPKYKVKKLSDGYTVSVLFLELLVSLYIRRVLKSKFMIIYINYDLN